MRHVKAVFMVEAPCWRGLVVCDIILGGSYELRDDVTKGTEGVNFSLKMCDVIYARLYFPWIFTARNNDCTVFSVKITRLRSAAIHLPMLPPVEYDLGYEDEPWTLTLTVTLTLNPNPNPSPNPRTHPNPNPIFNRNRNKVFEINRFPHRKARTSWRFKCSTRNILVIN